MKLVEAQEGRRVLDRLVGYEVSPVLWRRVGGARSAGRVQSVATRLVVERERERMAFRAAEYWDLDGRFAARGIEFGARLVELDGRRVATSRDFDAGHRRARARTPTRCTCARPTPGALAGRLARRRATRSRRPSRSRSPSGRRPPFKTTTMQQEAGNKLRFSAGRTMSVAQGLYERGYITYMRTDSMTAVRARRSTRPRAQIVERFGQAYLPPAPRTYANKVKNAQEAHEAIRPAGARFRTPEEVRGELIRDEQALYELIWMRTVASQMTDARGRSLTLRLARHVVARASTRSSARRARRYEFLGFRMAYVDVSDEPGSPTRTRRTSPRSARAKASRATAIDASGHTTQPPARYTEASLVKELEDSGDRPAVDVRVDHQHDHERARLRVEEGQRARPVVDRVREDAAARALLRAPRRLRLHRHDGGGARRGRAPARPRPRSGSTPSTSGTAPPGSTSSCPRSTSPRST